MLRQLRIFYYNNKVKVWLGLGIILFVYVIIQLINANIKSNNEKNLLNNTGNISTVNEQTYLTSKNDAVMSDMEVSQETTKKDTDVIKQFVEYCNNKDIEKAYALLSQDCKDEMYKTQDVFENNYVKEIFTESRSYDVQTWTGEGNSVVYKLKYLNDIMATGATNDEYIEDYVTVITENGEKKLNINQFIKKDNINKIIKKGDLEVNVTNRYVYYDYEEYEISFKNNGQDEIILDTKDDTESVYIKDTKDVKYHWFGNEIPNEYLKLAQGENRTFRVKFNKIYVANKSDAAIYFTDIHFNNEGNKNTLEINVR